MIQKLSDCPTETLNNAELGVEPKLQESNIRSFDGKTIDLQSKSLDDLYQLQWEQETGFARRIKSLPRGEQRSRLIGEAYQSVCQILATVSELEGETGLSMGMDQRYTDLVLKRLSRLTEKGISGGFFEVGFGSGHLLHAVAEQGYRVGGLEVAPQLLADAKAKLSFSNQENLCLGDFLDNAKVDSMQGQFSLVYWNDVFEHIPVDEIQDYLDRIYSLLVPGGELITITPNWHMRPMDVTAEYLGPRNTAIGFHLKEYTLSEVCECLKFAGFESVETPLFVGRKKIRCSRWFHATQFKRLIEPLLEWLPYSMAVQACRRLGMTMTFARKPLA